MDKIDAGRDSRRVERQSTGRRGHLAAIAVAGVLLAVGWALAARGYPSGFLLSALGSLLIVVVLLRRSWRQGNWPPEN